MRENTGELSAPHIHNISSSLSERQQRASENNGIERGVSDNEKNNPKTAHGRRMASDSRKIKQITRNDNREGEIAEIRRTSKQREETKVCRYMIVVRRSSPLHEELVGGLVRDRSIATFAHPRWFALLSPFDQSLHHLVSHLLSLSLSLSALNISSLFR